MALYKYYVLPSPESDVCYLTKRSAAEVDRVQCISDYFSAAERFRGLSKSKE